jgi:hypothetical protein
MLKYLIIALLAASPALAKNTAKSTPPKSRHDDNSALDISRANTDGDDLDDDRNVYPLDDNDRYENKLYQFRRGPELYNYFIIDRDGAGGFIDKGVGIGLRFQF